MTASINAIDETHDPQRTAWVPGADRHRDFPIQNLPLGVFSSGDRGPRIGTAIGNHILDLAAVAPAILEEAETLLNQPTLNGVMGLPAPLRRRMRQRLSALLSDPSRSSEVAHALIDASACTMHLPAAIGDYTDFYVGIHHATNIGKLFRPDNPLLPNYKHVPIGYHGRASSVRVSGAELRRPRGQRKTADAETPSLLPTARLDHELELGVWVGPGNALGQSIPIGEAAEHIAGLCLLNDWSSRDIQAWEYQPLGPFLSKNFLTTISPWVVTMEALAPFRVAQPARPDGDPQPLSYLWDDGDQATGAFALTLETWISSAVMRDLGMAPHQLSRGSATSMYWTVAQMVAHHSVNGCDLHPGDLLGTGTISTPDDTGLGSLMEMSRGGKETIPLPSGESRTFLEDGDELILVARAEAPGRVAIGFGECRGTVLPA